MFAKVTSKVFIAVQNLNTEELTKCSEDEIRPFLASLVRMCLLPSDNAPSRMLAVSRKQIMGVLVGIEAVNNIVSLLQVNFHELEQEIKKEQQLRKPQQSQQDAVQFHNLTNGIALGFERADMTKKVRIVISEFFYLQSQIAEHTAYNLNLPGGSGNNNPSRINTAEQIKSSELFNNEIYLEEIADIICVALTELPSLLSVQDIVETLLYVNHGNELICWIVANLPDSFKEIVTGLIGNGDEETPDGRIRLSTLYALSAMNPKQSLSTRALCVDMTKMPSLMLKLSLDDPKDLIAFVSGMLLGNDQGTRAWFAQYVRSNQKRKSDALQNVRDELQNQLQRVVDQMARTSPSADDEVVVQASAILRLYCALRGIAGIKFNEEEIPLLMQLITSRPLPSTAGIRFVSIGLCMLIACPSLIAQPALEAKGTDWVQWLIRDETYYASTESETSSFGEMLLLMAIHFHSNQLSAIGELVCTTLGMKIPFRPNNTTRMKQIFTQDIFTEQIVAAHAVKVNVTMDLNANMPGYLPVHCIHQLLKSRAFSKHKVPIKDWIYKQICCSTTPLHPVLPSLIEAYVTSILLTNTTSVAVQTIKGEAMATTHRPLSEAEILRVFQRTIKVGYNNKNIKNGDKQKHNSSGKATKKYFGFEFGGSTGCAAEVEALDGSKESNIAAQLLMLYYALLYEDVRLNNMTNLLLCGRKIKSYSTDFLSELPIKYLLQQAQRHQNAFGGLFAPLLKLLVTHFPHLSLVEDWLEEEELLVGGPAKSSRGGCKSQTMLSEQHVREAFEQLEFSPSKCVKLLKSMLRLPPKDLWYISEPFIEHFADILRPNTPKMVQELYKKMWIRLNTVLPRRLWAMSINSLMPPPTKSLVKSFALSHDHYTIDALHILRCDERVFRCPDALSVVLRVLQAGLAASKSQLQRHILDKPILEKTGNGHGVDGEREEFRLTLIYAQETAAVQILLEACLETAEDRSYSPLILQEVRGIICSYIHQIFISDMTLAKLVLFQGFSPELLSVVVRGVPSMHVCLLYIPELLNMPEMEKQIFAIDLASHLAMQYAMPKSYNTAKLCINILTTLLGGEWLWGMTFGLLRSFIKSTVLINSLPLQLFRGTFGRTYSGRHCRVWCGSPKPFRR